MRGELGAQFLICGEQSGAALPDHPGIVPAAGLLVLLAEPRVGFRELGLWCLGLLLLNQGLEMLDHLLALVERWRPIGHAYRLGEARLPVGRVKTQGSVEQLVSLHGQHGLFTHILDGAALFQVGLAQRGRVLGSARIVDGSLFQFGNRLVQLACVTQLFPCLPFLLVADLR